MIAPTVAQVRAAPEFDAGAPATIVGALARRPSVRSVRYIAALCPDL